MGWRFKLKLKDLINDDEYDYSGSATAKIAREMHERLEVFRLKHYPQDEDLDSVSDQFHTIGFVDGDAAECEFFNDVMGALYDWADDARVWID